MNSRPNCYQRGAWLVLLFVFPFILGCSDSVQPWNRADLAGCTYELKGLKQRYCFNADGSIIVAGPDREGNWWTGPIFAWEITTNGVLLLRDFQQQRIQFTFHKIAIDEKTARVLASGKRQTWRKIKG